jgi:molybdate transport system substrate-binding protein
MFRLSILSLTLLTCLAGSPIAVHAAEATVAVATNFVQAARVLAEGFGQQSGHRLKLVSGSTGKLYAQIRHGAPFDVLLAADTIRPERLVADGAALAGSRFTYAEGHLALIWAGGGAISFNQLKEGDFRKLALANPKLAPYGAAAEQVLRHEGLLERLRPQLVFGENIGQAYTLVATGNADAGMVALSQIMGLDVPPAFWLVPAEWHEPIRQDLVLLEHSKDNVAAAGFVDYLKTEAARQIIRDFGYATP